MIISHHHKFVFIHVQRTAGTSLTEIIKANLVDDYEELTQHSNVQSLQTRFFERFEDYHIFGFTRNPWERMASWYRLIHAQEPIAIQKDKIRFEEWLVNDQALDVTSAYFHYNTLDYFTDKEGHMIADAIYRFENLQKETNQLLERLDFRATQLPKLNTNIQQNHKALYTPNSIEHVALRCKRDIDYFNYEF